MGEDQKPDQSAAPEADSSAQSTPPDALEKTNEELNEEATTQPNADATGAAAPGDKPSEPKQAKQPSAFKKLLKRFNVYLLLFLLVVAIGVVISVVAILNGRKEPPIPALTNQTLDPDTLRQLANSDATVGDTGQTLTVQGNAIFSGQVLVRGNLNVAGTIQLGGEFSVPSLRVSSNANLVDTQTNTLQVANTLIVQGEVTLYNNLNVAGTTSFNGRVNVAEMAVTRLIMSGNAQLEVPNHINFSGASPGRVINAGLLGAGGSGSVAGSDTTGTINLNTGSNPGAGCLVRIRFNQPYNNTPHVIVSPVGAAAGQMNYYVDRTVNEFSLCSTNAPAANQVFAFDYFVTGL